jgi:hypothetical protein
MKLTAAYTEVSVRIADEPLRRMPDYPGPNEGPTPDPVGERLKRRKRRWLKRHRKRSYPLPHSESLPEPIFM